MTRVKIQRIFLAIVLVLAVVGAYALASEAQTSVTIHNVQESPSSVQTGTVASAVPEVLACEGCSGGGTGPF